MNWIYEYVWLKWDSFCIAISRLYDKLRGKKYDLDDPEKRKWIEYNILKNKTWEEREEWERYKQEVNKLLDEHFK